jgi:hypothetical protein
MRSEHAAAVFAWVSVRLRATLHTTSVSKAEILYGIAALPEGPRRPALAAAAEAMFADDFEAACCPSTRPPPSIMPRLSPPAAAKVARSRPSTPRSPATARVAGAGLAARDTGDLTAAVSL